MNLRCRVWNGEENAWRDYFYIDAVTGESAFSDKDNYILQQYIGLKDKSKKEIFEGDIVKLNWDGETGLAKVVYWKNGFYCENANGNILGDTVYLFKYCEIIGNIVENPELFK